jgi:hypothetical protein
MPTGGSWALAPYGPDHLHSENVIAHAYSIKLAASWHNAPVSNAEADDGQSPRTSSFDGAILQDLTSAMTQHLVGRSVTVSRGGVDLAGSVDSLHLEPADYTISAQLEAGLAAWSGVSAAAFDALQRPRADGASSVFGAFPDGIDKVRGANPVDPLLATAKLAKQLSLTALNVTHPQWTARYVGVTTSAATASLDPGGAKVTAETVELTITLSRDEAAGLASAADESTCPIDSDSIGRFLGDRCFLGSRSTRCR